MSSHRMKPERLDGTAQTRLLTRGIMETTVHQPEKPIRLRIRTEDHIIGPRYKMTNNNQCQIDTLSISPSLVTFKAGARQPARHSGDPSWRLARSVLQKWLRLSVNDATAIMHIKPAPL